MSLRFHRALAAAAALLLAGSAAAQCTLSPDTSQVTVPDFLAVYYLHFRSVPELDEAVFYGGVCVTAVGGEWTVIASEATVTGLTGELGLRAEDTQLFWGDLRMSADHLAATTETLVLQSATLQGPDFSGDAATIELDLVTGEMALTEFTLAGVAFAVSGASAMLAGQTLEVTAPAITTCIGMEVTPYAIEGESASLDLTTRTAELRGGTLRVGALRVGLRPRIEISEETLETFTLPVRVQNVDDRGDPTRPGSGVGARVVGLPLGDEGAASLEVGATGIDAAHPLGLVALVRLAEEEAGRRVEATFGLEAGLPLLDLAATRAVAPWLDLSFGVHSGAELNATPYHEGRLGLAATTAVRVAPGVPAVRLRGEAFAAATALATVQDPATPAVFGPRLGAAVGLEAGSGATAVGTFALRVRAQATLYPRQDALQWGVRLNPSWRASLGPLTAALAYDTWLTNAASPFAGLDRLDPLARTTGSARLEGELHRWEGGEVLTGFLEARATHDGVAVGTAAAGLNSAVAAAGVEYAVGDWTVGGSVTAQLAGVIEPAAGRDASITYTLAAERMGWPVVAFGVAGPIVPHGTLLLRAEARQGLVPDDDGLRRLELSVAAPVAFENLELRPSVGFDFAPMLLGEGRPWLSVHGLDLTFVTCCGSLTVGYVNERGQWSASFAIDLERRPPTAR